MVDHPQALQSLRQRILSLSPEQRQLFRQQLTAKGISWDQVSDSVLQETVTPDSAPDSKTDSAPDSAPDSTLVFTRPQKLPLSASQKHLWVFHQLYPNTTAYHISLALTIKGELDINAMRQSLQDIVDRHESLRTIFLKRDYQNDNQSDNQKDNQKNNQDSHQSDNQPYTEVLPTVQLELPITDLRQVENSVKTVTDWQEKLSQMPFDLAQGPLIRVRLLQLENNHFEFILILHHLISDGWSRGILLKELFLNYQQHTQQLTSQPTSQPNAQSAILPKLKIQYPDYSVQQQQWLKSDECEQQRTYWKQQLGNLPELNLPTDSADSSTNVNFTGKTCTRTFSTEQTQLIKAFAKQSGATVFMVLLAIFKLLLHRYSGQRDLAVGVPIAGRNTPAVEPLIGFFVNTLVLRSHISPHQSFADWLQQIQATLADALQHQDIPFSNVVEAVGAARLPGKNPLFRLMFQVQSDGYQLQNAEQLGLAMPELTLTQRWIEPHETKFDMSWHVIERDGRLLVAVEYKTGLFKESRVDRMLAHFDLLTHAVVLAPNQTISQFSLLSAEEESLILNNWSQGRVVESPTVCFPSRFEQQVDQTPEAIAVADYAQSVQNNRVNITYRQLNQRANKLAHWLRSQGVGPDILVGVCLGPGVDLMVALLATLKAGGAYIPLDPTLPFERLQYMVRDAKPAILMGHDNTIVARLIQHQNARENARENAMTLFCIGQDEQRLISQPSHNLAAIANSTNLAYVIYTSGSTGKPKGTQLTHGGLINYLDWCLKAYPVHAGCGAPVASSIGFDATITSLFSPLLAGKQVVFGLGNSKDSAEIEALIAALSGGFSFIKLTPAHLSALRPLVAKQYMQQADTQQIDTQQIDRDRLPKAFIIGGESLRSQHISFWRKHYPEITLINEYGPTEAVVGCCVHWVTNTDTDEGNIPIGRPIDGTQLYILDEHQQPVPVGVPGELYVGGAGVARGYLNQPALTTDRFITPPPFLAKSLAKYLSFPSDISSSRLYKTGDLATYLPNGTLKYLGRIDDQIKLRGFRIEPGEIEAALCQCEPVEQALVVLYEDQNRRELVAYLTAATEAGQEENKVVQLADELRKQLRQSLPSYMVPAHFVWLEALPLTSHGKIDRQALPSPPTAVSIAQSSQPRDRKEAVLTEIWQQILNRSEVSIYDNFFDLGGDSISAMQIVSKAHQHGLHLTPTQLFQSQTIAEQAVVATVQPLTKALTTTLVGSVPLSPIQQAFFEQALANPHHFNQAIMLTVEPDIQSSALKAALNQLAQHHDSLRLRFEQKSGVWEQHYSESERVSVPLDEVDIVSQESFQDSSQVSLTLENVMASFQTRLNLSEGPLFRGILITLNSNGTSRKRLLLIAHHLVVDGVSWRILLADLITGYQQARNDQAITLPAKTTTFGHWTSHLQDLVQKGTFEAEYAYWADACRPTLPLPIDEPDAPLSRCSDDSDDNDDRNYKNRAAHIHEAVVSLDAETTVVLKSLKQPVEIILLTALAQTLRQWSHCDSITLDMEAHGRRVWNDSLDLSRTVGWFTALYPLKLLLPSGALSEQLNRVKDQLNQVPNGGVGYGVLRSQLSQLKDSSAEALNSPAQVSFNYLGQLNIENNIENIEQSSILTGIAPEPVTHLKSPDSQRRRYLLEIVALIQAGQLQAGQLQAGQLQAEQLQIRWRYSPKQYRQITIEQLSQRFYTNLKSLLAEATQAHANRVMPTHFTAAGVEAGQLNKLIGKLQARGGQSS